MLARPIAALSLAGFLALTGAAVSIGAMPAGQDIPTVEQAEFFEKRVRPVLAERCFGCHAGQEARSGLRLDSRGAAIKGGARGAAIVAGEPEKSLLIRAVSYLDHRLQMPPKGRLPESEREALAAWIRMGAPWPAGETGKRSKDLESFNLQERLRHWCWKPLRRPAVPAIPARNPIDAFIRAKLQAAGLTLSPEADRRTLIRRVTFDLTGLPPTPEEIQSFLEDPSERAYEKVVDRLLASPHYGERWARHWLDLVRYAETDGHEFDFDKPNAWRYRDYVIRAFNEDIPFDQFVREHIAGDLLPNPRINPREGINESILGTGFWWLGEGKHSPVDLLVDEAERIDNQIDVFGKAFLGLTVGCARCHDHKFDALTSKDYYALSGYLKSSRYRQAAIDLPELRRPAIEALRRARDAVCAGLPPSLRTGSSVPEEGAPGEPGERFDSPELEGWFADGEAFTPEGLAPGLRIRPSGPRFSPGGAADSGALSSRLHGALRSRTFPIRKRFILYRMMGADAQVRLIVEGFQRIRDPLYGNLAITPRSAEHYSWHAQDVARHLGRRAYIELLDQGPGFLSVDEIRFADSVDGLEQLNRESQLAEAAVDPSLVGADALARFREVEAALPEPRYALAMTDGTGEDDRLHIRGSPHTLGEVVPRRFLEACGGRPGAAPENGSGRLELALRMTDPAVTPLLPRVIVNRLWHHHFGRGIVKSTDDFGLMGDPPTHPELLDWLASELIDGPGRRWSLKRIHRLIVTSATYRQTSARSPESVQKDPENRLLSRMNVRRLEAEAVRDTLLAVSGRLNRALYGPSVMPHLTPFMDGRGRPTESGPLDGDGRRSIYISVRRNFLTPMLLAFDFPVPFSCIGRRTVSNVPAQALTLLNNPLALQQARLWAKRILERPGSVDSRIERMYLEAFGRPPTREEALEAEAFLVEGAGWQEEAWAGLAHVLMNLKELLFVR